MATACVPWMAHRRITLVCMRQHALRAGTYLMVTGMGGAVAYLIASTTAASNKIPVFPYWIFAGLLVTGALLWLYGQLGPKPGGNAQSEPPRGGDQAGTEAVTAEQPRSGTLIDVRLHVEQLLDGLDLGDHEEAERRVNRLFLHIRR